MAESWKKLKTSNVFSSNRNGSALVRELLRYNSLFVGFFFFFFRKVKVCIVHKIRWITYHKVTCSTFSLASDKLVAGACGAIGSSIPHIPSMYQIRIDLYTR